MIKNKLHEVMEVCALYLGYKPAFFLEFLGKRPNDEMVDTTGRAKSEGASPTRSPQKWKEESEGELTVGGQEGRGNDGGGRGTGVVRERRNDSESMLSSDEDGYVGETESTSRPGQRSLRRKKVGFTNNLTSKQLVREDTAPVLSMDPHAHTVTPCRGRGNILAAIAEDYTIFVLSLSFVQESLNLQPGANKVVFSITTKYQVM